jgi:hypothetical protein
MNFDLEKSLKFIQKKCRLANKAIVERKHQAGFAAKSISLVLFPTAYNF